MIQESVTGASMSGDVRIKGLLVSFVSVNLFAGISVVMGFVLCLEIPRRVEKYCRITK